MATHRTLREGIIAGVIGATAVAAWFFVVDLVEGRPFYTPATLGSAVMSFFGPDRGETMFQHVALYTLIHYLAFIVTGIVVSAIVNASEREPSVLVGLFILFVAFEGGFYLFMLFLSGYASIGNIAWYQIGAANLLAAALMGTYLLRRHPETVGKLAESLRGM
jgi:hypothetical protein